MKKEVFQVLTQVITSWQVIFITIALVLFLNIVFYTARTYHTRRRINIKIRRKKKSSSAAAMPEVVQEETE
jgi:cell division protein FtsL